MKNPAPGSWLVLEERVDRLCFKVLLPMAVCELILLLILVIK